MSDTIKIGISACLIGESVRFDRTSAADPYLVEVLSKYVEFVPLCPEMACGMGVPREEVRQIDCGGEIRLIGADSAEDWTDRMAHTCDSIVSGLKDENLMGFVLKSRSPSCGYARSMVFSTKGKTPRKDNGFFAKRLIDANPLMPIESDERLENPILRENFIRRVFVLKRWQMLLAKGKTLGHLVDFHTRHKLLIRAHDLRGYKQLGALLGESSVFNVDEVFDTYATLLFRSLSLKATTAKTADVLRHACSLVRRYLDVGDVNELQHAIHEYKGGKIPFLIPVTLINHHARKLGKPYLTQQYLLNPDPAELRLLEHS